MTGRPEDVPAFDAALAQPKRVRSVDLLSVIFFHNFSSPVATRSGVLPLNDDWRELNPHGGTFLPPPSYSFLMIITKS